MGSLVSKETTSFGMTNTTSRFALTIPTVLRLTRCENFANYLMTFKNESSQNCKNIWKLKIPYFFAHKMSPPHNSLFRYRIGDYRAIVSAENKLLTIHDVGHRREIYQ